MTSYHQEYEGYYSMRWHDDEQNALKRWFDNFKLDKNAYFASECECLLVMEVPAFSRNIKKRQVCQIEDERMYRLGMLRRPPNFLYVPVYDKTSPLLRIPTHRRNV